MAENKVLQAPNRENRGLQGPQLNIEDNRGYQKVAVIKSLTDYAILLADKKFHHNNLKTVHDLLLMNNFPPQFITKHINKRILEIRNRNNNKLDINKVTGLNKSVISFPYYGDLSENIKRLFKDMNVRIVFRSESKLNTFINTGKDHLEFLTRRMSYIGFLAFVASVIQVKRNIH